MSTSDKNIGPETTEWVEQLAASWVEVYKKSLTTLILLELIQAHGPATATDIRELFIEQTGWSITERGLYRTLKRLADADILAVEKLAAPGPGASKKAFSLTPPGALYLAKITAAQVR